MTEFGIIAAWLVVTLGGMFLVVRGLSSVFGPEDWMKENKPPEGSAEAGRVAED